MTPLILALMLSLRTAAPQQGDLRISIAGVESSTAEATNPEFAITVENPTDTDLVIVLGYMIANGKTMVPSAVSLAVRDDSGHTISLRYRPERIGGRVDDYAIPLRRGASYTLRVSLGEYRRDPGWGDPTLPTGSYTVQATLDAQAPHFSGPDMAGVRLLRIWSGAATSNVLRFSVP